MPTLNHTHTYRRLKKNLYICTDPHCTFQEKKEVLIGKAAKCNSCGEEFVLDFYSFRVAFPKCLNCRETKDAKERKRLKGEIEDLFKKEDSASNAPSL